MKWNAKVFCVFSKRKKEWNQSQPFWTYQKINSDSATILSFSFSATEVTMLIYIIDIQAYPNTLACLVSISFCLDLAYPNLLVTFKINTMIYPEDEKYFISSNSMVLPMSSGPNKWHYYHTGIMFLHWWRKQHHTSWKIIMHICGFWWPC